MPQYSTTPERERILARYPDYAVEIVEAPGRFTVTLDDVVVADSDRALEMRESFHSPVVYFPPDAVKFDLLERTERVTRCPFKGDASYYSVVTDGVRVDNAAWVYETPMEEVAGIAGHLAFYPERLKLVRGD